MKFKLVEMSWMEAEEAFKKSDTVILPTGTIHGHGPTPINIDASSAEWLADKVGEKTGILTLPCTYYGENEKQKYYPGSIAISEETLQRFYEDIFRSVRRNGARKVLVVNGHGGNRESIIRASRTARELGMIIAIVDWYSTARVTMAEDFPDLYITTGGKSYIVELAVALAIDGKEIADLREGEGYRGEWGNPYTVRQIFGEKIKTLQFNDFEFQGGPVIIPIQAWDIDLDGPPILGPDVVDNFYEQGKKLLDRLVDYLVDFAKEFEKVDISQALRSKDPE